VEGQADRGGSAGEVQPENKEQQNVNIHVEKQDKKNIEIILYYISLHVKTEQEIL
jgi:hypothetical protein